MEKSNFTDYNTKKRMAFVVLLYHFVPEAK
jgi:hypothetical protein